jgi:hypothetical protein
MTTIAECNLIAQSDHLRWLKRLILPLSEHVPGNDHVGQLLVGRLVFTPKRDETGRHYEFVGQGSISKVVCGAVLPKEWWPQRDTRAGATQDSGRRLCHVSVT